MAYPTPSIYTYRVLQVSPVNAPNSDTGYYVAQYSANSGTTWNPVHPLTFESLVEAYQAIKSVVDNEAGFRTAIQHPNSFNVMPVVPTSTTHAYPPS